MRLTAAPALHPIIARIPAQKTYKKVGGSPFQGLNFSRHGDKLSVDSGSTTNGERIQAHSNRISSKERVNRPSFLKILLIQSSKYQQEHCILMPCWAFLYRLDSGFLVGPTRRAWGSVRLFCIRAVSLPNVQHDPPTKKHQED